MLSHNDENVIYGQGTMGVELIEDITELECILVPIGGGGMISGVALSAMNFENRNIFVIGCEQMGEYDALDVYVAAIAFVL